MQKMASQVSQLFGEQPGPSQNYGYIFVHCVEVEYPEYPLKNTRIHHTHTHRHRETG